MSAAERTKRSIRSYVRRSGRLTPSQQRAIDEMWSTCGVDYVDRPLDLDALFGHDAPKVLEIGFGNGDSLVQMAHDHPEWDFLGIEVHEPGVGHCLIRVRELQLTNLRIVSHDALEVMRDQLSSGSLARINLYFPDPWPKKRHHKRRIVNQTFLALAGERLGRGGSLHIATDWQPYAEQINEVVANSGIFDVAERREHAGDRPLDRPSTKFEQRGIREGHRIWDWRLEPIQAPNQAAIPIS